MSSFKEDIAPENIIQPLQNTNLDVIDNDFRVSDEPSNDESCYESDYDEVTSKTPVQGAFIKKQVVQTQKNTLEQRLDAQVITQGKRFSFNLAADVIVSQEQALPDEEIVAPIKPPEAAPMPLIKSGASVLYDMKEGWRPSNEILSGAPIPLYYDYEELSPPLNPLTNKPYIPLYYGPRRDNSLDVHKAFALKVNGYSNQIPKIYDCGPVRANEEFPIVSYSFKFPRKVPQKQKQNEYEREFTGMNKKFDLTNELIFDSDFESGNLDMVIKTAEQEYDLYMRVDTNTRGHHQWFYFTVTYPTEWHKRTVSFTVCNFTKDSSLYNHGMRIAIARKSQDYLWYKAGDEIEYKKSKIVRRFDVDPFKMQYYFSLRFKFTFDGKAKTDTVCFAYCYPYTVSKLQRFLKRENLQQKGTDIFSESTLCKSLSGMDVPLLTITSRLHSDPKGYGMIKMSEFEETDSRLSLPLYKRKKYAIISARVHPGESNSSYMMQGLIKYLLGESHQAKELRKRIVFKIIPMSNPDGVVIGNYRTSMVGHDLNRRYHEPDFRLHPTIVAIKQLTSELVFGKNSEPEDVVAFIDMHGHSRKKNTFVYGPEVPLHSDKYYKMRIIPKLIAEETSKFRYFSCKFRHETSKLKAARIVMWRQFNIFNCYTYEASLHGYFDENNQNYEFNCVSYEEMGEHLVNGLYEYMMIQEEEERRRRLKEIEKRRKRKLKKYFEQKQSSRQDFINIKQENQDKLEKQDKPDRQDTIEQATKSDMPKRKQTAAISTNREKNPSVIVSEVEKKGKKGRKKKIDQAKQVQQFQQLASLATDTEPNLQIETLNNPNEPPSSRNSSAQP